jgi:hypothetical protein
MTLSPSPTEATIRHGVLKGIPGLPGEGRDGTPGTFAGDSATASRGAGWIVVMTGARLGAPVGGHRR